MKRASKVGDEEATISVREQKGGSGRRGQRRGQRGQVRVEEGGVGKGAWKMRLRKEWSTS